jgi:hypothetical protein
MSQDEYADKAFGIFIGAMAGIVILFLLAVNHVI